MVYVRRGVTVLAVLLVLFALVGPNSLPGLTPWAFFRVPLEGLLLVALLLVLPPRPRTIVAVLCGVVLGLLTIVKAFDIGFTSVLARPFDIWLDWSFLKPAVDFLGTSIGTVGAIAVAVGAGLVALGLLVLMTLAVLRLTRLLVAHRASSARTVAVLSLAWIVCAVLGVQIVAGQPVAANSAAALAYDHVHQVAAGISDRSAFRTELASDRFRSTPSSDLLTALRGKDVVLVYVESYGRVALEDPTMGPGVRATLDEGTRRLQAAGFSARSGFLTSSTAGGGSWLAHDTLLSGLWVDNAQRHQMLLSSSRMTLGGAFRKAGWRTVGVMPGVTQDWPEGKFFGYSTFYGAKDLGYNGPRYSFSTMPDQFTMEAFQRLERTGPHAPVMAEIPLTSSHAPWSPVPTMLPWGSLGDGMVYKAPPGAGDLPEIVFNRDINQVRANYRDSVEYSVNTLVSYVETYGDDNLVLIFLGDHQPAPILTGAGASRDVPITIVARDSSVLDRIAGWGWHNGLRPDPSAPVWRMDAFRDRFLSAFSSVRSG